MLKVTRRAMETAMLGILLRDRIRNAEVRKRTKETAITNNQLSGSRMQATKNWSSWKTLKEE